MATAAAPGKIMQQDSLFSLDKKMKMHKVVKNIQ